MSNNPLRGIPSVHELLESPQLRKVVDQVNHNVVVSEVRRVLDSLRQEIQQKATEVRIPAAGELAERIAKWIESDHQPRLSPVINATGVLLHTGLGRAPLADSALQEICAVSQGYATVEVDLESGERSQRMQAVERTLLELTGAEAALVVNNNAGATLLTLSALAKGREVIVSRGQLVEIGGSYRLPEVMELSGAVLREVGTTNKTRLADYESAIHEATGALLRVHPSNYVIHGFTQEVGLAELVQLGRRSKLPVIDDIGSGALVDLKPFGLVDEPLPKESLEQGADLVLFSGDKLLGGPQAGIILGKADLIKQLTKHPLTRALRVDKLTLAALAATLRLYLRPSEAMAKVPLLMLLGVSQENLQNRAERIAPQLAAAPSIASVDIVLGTAYLGGGSVPTQELPSVCLALTPREGSVDQLAKRLRTGAQGVFGRIQQDRLLLDLRTVFPRQDTQLVQAVQTVSAE